MNDWDEARELAGRCITVMPVDGQYRVMLNLFGGVELGRYTVQSAAVSLRCSRVGGLTAVLLRCWRKPVEEAARELVTAAFVGGPSVVMLSSCLGETSPVWLADAPAHRANELLARFRRMLEHELREHRARRLPDRCATASQPPPPLTPPPPVDIIDKGLGERRDRAHVVRESPAQSHGTRETPEPPLVAVNLMTADAVRLTLKPGDALAVRLPEWMNAEQGYRMAARIGEFLGVKCVSLDPGVELSVVESEKP